MVFNKQFTIVFGLILLLTQSSSPDHTAIVAAPWPFNLAGAGTGAGINGEARFRLAIQNGVVTDVQLLGDAPPGLETYGRTVLQGWRFEPSPPHAIEVTLRHLREGATGCEQDTNQIVRATLPTLVEVIDKRFVTLCESGVETIEWSDAVAGLAGEVRCDCPAQTLVPGALLRVQRVGNARGFRERTVRADSKGAFRVSALDPGRYVVNVSADGFERRAYRLLISTTAASGATDLFLKSQAPQAKPAIVTAGTIPTYPSAAMAAGVQGSVDLSVSMQGNTILDIDGSGDDSRLTSAAKANVATWRFDARGVPVVHVHFEYRLQDGDCKTASQSVVTMQLPREVTVQGTRCSSAEPLELSHPASRPRH